MICSFSFSGKNSGTMTPSKSSSCIGGILLSLLTTVNRHFPFEPQ